MAPGSRVTPPAPLIHQSVYSSVYLTDCIDIWDSCQNIIFTIFPTPNFATSPQYQPIIHR